VTVVYKATAPTELMPRHFVREERVAMIAQRIAVRGEYMVAEILQLIADDRPVCVNGCTFRPDELLQALQFSGFYPALHDKKEDHEPPIAALSSAPAPRMSSSADWSHH